MNVIPKPQGISLSFCQVGMRLCTGFFVAQTPVKTEWPAEWDMILRWPLFWRVSKTTSPNRGAGTAFRQTDKIHTGKTAKMSHTVTSRETVLTVSTPTGSMSRLLFGESPNPLKKSRKDWCYERSQEQKFMVLVNQCVDIDLKRHQLIATDILHAMPVTIVPDCT